MLMYIAGLLIILKNAYKYYISFDEFAFLSYQNTIFLDNRRLFDDERKMCPLKSTLS